MNFFRRKPAGPLLPEEVFETWSAENKQVLVTIPFDATDRDASATSDKLSDAVIATVNAIQNGEFGHCIPEGTTGATVAVQVHTGITPLGPMPTRTLDILREQVGKAMEITVQTDPAPEGLIKEDDGPSAPFVPQIPRTGANGEKLGLWASLKAAADQQSVQVQENLTPLAPRTDLAPAFFSWDEENDALRADVVLLAEADSDRQTQADVNFLVEKTIASLAAPSTLELIPEGNTQYGIWLTVAVNEDAAGPLTRKKLEQGEDQFDGTRIDFVVMIEPREVIEEMLAG